MNYHRYFATASKPVESCLVGVGDFGRSLISQARHVKLMNARVAVDISAERAAESFVACGHDRREVAVCNTAREARAAWDAGRAVAVDDLDKVLELPIDVVVEATGHPEAAARHARLAIEAGRHLALASKEVDIVIGPGLAAEAGAAGRTVTPIDGDQPSLLIGKVTWAETLGLEIVAAGKSSEYDFIYDAARAAVSIAGRTVDAAELEPFWHMDSAPIADLIAARADALRLAPQRTVPDLCEMLIAANAVDLAVDRPDLHAPVLRIPEVPTAFSTLADGGVLGGGRRVDVFNCLRRPDDVSFAGGVFVVVRCDDPYVWNMLREKGHVLSRSGNTAMLYLPRHILGVEAAISVLSAGIHGASTGADAPLPRYDLAARADADLPAGTVLTAVGHHHSIRDVSGWAVPGARLTQDSPVPYYLAANRTLTRSVARGQLISCGDVELPEESELLRLRRRQDARFFQ